MNQLLAFLDRIEYGGTHSLATVEDNVSALQEWVERKNEIDGVSRQLTIEATLDGATLLESDEHIQIEIARFPFRYGCWGLQCKQRDGSWADYAPDGRYLTLTIPILLVDEDVYGCFWG